jgi:hypothetical protein
VLLVRQHSMHACMFWVGAEALARSASPHVPPPPSGSSAADMANELNCRRPSVMHVN